MERLNKVLAQAGIASRRKADEIVLAGRVKVNGTIITELGYKVKKSDVVLVDDKPIVKALKKYFLLNKPTGCLSTTADDKKRRTVMDLLAYEDKEDRLYPIGRLDFDAAGAIILTNDGDLTKALTYNQRVLETEYLVRVKGIVIKEKIRQLRLGIVIENDLKVVPIDVQLMELDKKNQSTLIRIILNEVKNKQVKSMMKAMGHEVKNITRIRYDFLTLEGVGRGSYRPLKIHEIKRLQEHL